MSTPTTTTQKEKPVTFEGFEMLSPDGFSISFDEVYANEKAAEEAFTVWAKRFEAQGYYSSNRGRIALSQLRAACTTYTSFLRLTRIGRGRN